MKLAQLFPIVPVLSAVALLATPATGRSDHKVTILRDRDGDGHYTKKTLDLSHDHRGHHSRPYIYHRPYPYGYPYYGPSVSLNFSRTYSSPSPSDDLAVDVQRELRRRGYYRGSIDGDVGPGTRNAIANYQGDRGLPVTGRIDRNLLRSLGID
ncbi:MAG: peptidoglycan-binding domain-containing protein [Chthoniobacteraceae bacterium]